MASSRNRRTATPAPAPEAKVTAAPKVDHVLPEVTEMLPIWETVRDCLDGQGRIKSRETKYLPMPNAADKSAENIARYDGYKTRAVFINMVGRTLAGMVGTVFSKAPVMTVPAALDVLHDNVDGGAVTIDQQAKQVLSDALSVGRCGLLTDYPQAPKDEVNPDQRRSFTREEVNAGIARPVIQYYFAEDIINWRYTTDNAIRQLSLVVLREKYVEEDDGFVATTGTQYRVLRLVNKVYTVEIYRKGPSGIYLYDAFTPTKADSKPFDYITFEFVGSRNNDGGIDEAPLLDLANINIAHYRNSADFEEMVFILGQPTTVISGLSEHWAKEILNGEVVMGSTRALLLPENATAQYLEVTESQIALKAMEHKEAQAIAIGAKLVNQATVQRTAKEATMDDASEQSVLLSATANVNSAYKRSLMSAALFAGAPITADIGYELNTDFEILSLDAAALAARIKAWSDGAITFTEVRSILKRAGWATMDDDAARAELEADAAANAAALGLGDPADPQNNAANDGNTPPPQE